MPISSPSFNCMIPMIPAMLDTLWVPSRGPSCNLMSPLGLSMTSVGADGVDGEEKAY